MPLWVSEPFPEEGSKFEASILGMGAEMRGSTATPLSLRPGRLASWNSVPLDPESAAKLLRGGVAAVGSGQQPALKQIQQQELVQEMMHS